MVNPMLFFYCVLVIVMSAVMAAVMVVLQRWFSMAFFGLLAVVFAVVSTQYGAVITLDDIGICRSIFGIHVRTLTWKQIKEVGVAGLRVLKREESNRVGTLYIYFSEKKMTDQERFDMVLRWPQWNRCYLRFSHERIKAVQMLWDRKIETYNVGDLTFGEGLKN